MLKINRLISWFAAGWLVTLCACTTTAQQPEGLPQTATDSVERPDGQEAMPHVRVDRVGRFVDVDASVNLREADWLELLACTPDSRTHESILVTEAQPSHIHLGLVMLGLEPGSPMRWEKIEHQYRVDPAYGPKVAVSIVMDDGGQLVEVPANQWLANQETGKPPKDNIWLFTGSIFSKKNDPPTYVADLSGTVLSLVHFGDDVLARATDQTNHSDNGAWQCHTQAIPPVGTQVVIRLRPVVGDEPTLGEGALEPAVTESDD